MAHHVDYARKAGSRCRLAIYLVDSEGWTVENVYTRMFSEVLETLRSGLTNAASTPDYEVDGGTKKFIAEKNKDEAVKIIDYYLDPRNKKTWINQVNIGFLLAHGRNPPSPTMRNEGEDDAGSLLNVLRENGIYFPCSHAPDTDENRAAIKFLLDPPQGAKCLWDYEFPDPPGNRLARLGDMTWKKLFTQTATVLYDLAPDTFHILQTAKRLGIIRAVGTKKAPGDPHGLIAPGVTPPYVFQTGGNHKCCLNGICNSDAALPGNYCEEVQGGGCSAMSDPCPGS